ncbi:DeoR/GlpR family DNA-binding transcription regulator [Streptomyces sp. NPDC055078]
MAIDGTVAGEQRRTDLLATLKEVGEVRLQEVADRWDVHPMTIRRDLGALERQGLVRRVRGGAVYVGPEGFDSRRGRSSAGKRSMADKLRALLPERGSLGLDASSTVYEFAASLDAGATSGLTVLTHGVETYMTLRGRGCEALYLTGGLHDSRTGSLVGPLARGFAAEFSLDLCFVSTTALDEGRGSSEPTAEEAEMKRAIASASKTVVLVSDSTKLGRQSIFQSLNWDSVDLLVTELKPADHRLDAYRDLVEIR